MAIKKNKKDKIEYLEKSKIKSGYGALDNWWEDYRWYLFDDDDGYIDDYYFYHSDWWYDWVNSDEKLRDDKINDILDINDNPKFSDIWPS